MVLNSLDVDPGRIWKGPWRYFHESMIDDCVPLAKVSDKQSPKRPQTNFCMFFFRFNSEFLKKNDEISNKNAKI